MDQLKNYYPDSNFSEQTSAQQSETDFEEIGDATAPTTSVSDATQPPSPPSLPMSARRASERSHQRPDYYGH